MVSEFRGTWHGGLAAADHAAVIIKLHAIEAPIWSKPAWIVGSEDGQLKPS
jgi:hypothetical protein